MTLVLDTSVRTHAQVTLYRDVSLVDELVVSSSSGHSQIALPAIQELLRKNGIPLTALTAITVHRGPGSYTGLRVGGAIGQALAYTLNIPVNGKAMPGESLEVVYE